MLGGRKPGPFGFDVGGGGHTGVVKNGARDTTCGVDPSGGGTFGAFGRALAARSASERGSAMITREAGVAIELKDMAQQAGASF